METHCTVSSAAFRKKEKPKILKLSFESGFQSNFRTLIRQDFVLLFSNLLANNPPDRFEILACTLLYFTT